MIKLVIFDYDGVIVDSFITVYDIYKTIGSKLNVKIPSTIEEFRKTYGDNFSECYKNLGIDKDNQTKAMKIFGEELENKNPEIFCGIKDVLSWANEHYEVILISSNYTKEVLQKLENNNIHKYFSFIDGNCAINKSEKFKFILEKYKLKSNEVIVIGDRLSDYTSAIEAEIEHIIIVEYGWGYDRNKCPNNKFVINEAIQLIDAIKEIDVS
ncbi:HAD family hydrolase [Clostridium algoriphilum]|uniref:HAD family hydrolase n=1 Tax=Clostridium algoriphilum TaxID=198347 RepID=UPI001CF10080|nr:HAD-IA family hydrolase [Clostridium algoriphilum]MCB2293401.1 HAD family hydrolase [Clostridium algoriphilum]